MIGTVQSNKKKSLINGIRVRVLRTCKHNSDWLEVIVLTSYKQYSRNDILIIPSRWFVKDCGESD